jgi:hypothetical protein
MGCWNNGILKYWIWRNEIHYSKGWLTATLTPPGEIKVRLLANFTAIKEKNNGGIT